MKIDKSFIEAGAAHHDERIIRYIQQKYRAKANADFFGLENSDASLRQFVEHLHAREIFDDEVINRLVAKIIAGSLHPLQCIRLSQIINDPDEELEGEDKEILITLALDLIWPEHLERRS